MTAYCPASRTHCRNRLKSGPNPDARHLPDGCRCLVDTEPTRKLVRSLVAGGWSIEDQGDELGLVYGRNLDRMIHRPRIQRISALRVARLHDRLWNVPGPSPRSVTHAINQGWPYADPVVVARLVAGQDCPRNEVERDVAIRLLAREGGTTNEISRRLHTRFATVRRVLDAA